MASKNTKALQSIAAEATEWLVRLSDARDNAQNREFKAWLLRSPVHVDEFLRASALHEQLQQSAKTWRFNVEELLAEVDTNVMALHDMPVEDSAAQDSQPPLSTKRLRRRFAVAALAAGVVISLFGWYWLEPPEYATDVSEQRSVVLADGSIIELNTRSRVQVKLSKDLRQVILLEGEAIFQVAKDPARPFVVVSNGVQVRALGTRFNVYRQSRQVVVTVVEGLVSVSHNSAAAIDESPVDGRQPIDQPPAATGQKPLRLVPGEQVAVTSGGVMSVKTKIDVERTIAWTARQLIFDEDSLEFAVSEFNRYNTRQIILADQGLRERRITGVFNANEPASLVAFLNSLEGVEVSESANGNTVVRRSLAIRP